MPIRRLISKMIRLNLKMSGDCKISFMKPPIHYMDTTINNQPLQLVTEMPNGGPGLQQTPL